MAPEPLMTYQEAAVYLGVSVRTLEDWVHDRSVPFQKVGKRLVRFRPSALDAWMEQRTRAVAS